MRHNAPIAGHLTHANNTRRPPMLSALPYLARCLPAQVSLSVSSNNAMLAALAVGVIFGGVANGVQPKMWELEPSHPVLWLDALSYTRWVLSLLRLQLQPVGITCVCVQSRALSGPQPAPTPPTPIPVAPGCFSRFKMQVGPAGNLHFVADSSPCCQGPVHRGLPVRVGLLRPRAQLDAGAQQAGGARAATRCATAGSAWLSAMLRAPCLPCAASSPLTDCGLALPPSDTHQVRRSAPTGLSTCWPTRPGGT
jgi:hypothetical protein